MTATNKKTAWLDSPDKFPGLLENPAGYRKGSDDYAVTFAVPIAHVERLQPLMQKAGRVFVVYLRQVGSPEQAEYLLSQVDVSSGSQAPQNNGGDHISCAEIAALFGYSERRVQQLEKEGVFFKAAHDRYDLKKSIAGYVQDRKTRNKTSVLNQRREENLEKKNRELDRQHAIEMGKLHRNDDCVKLRENEWGHIRKKLDYLPALTPDLVGLDHGQMEKRLKEFKNELYKELYRPRPPAVESIEEDVDNLDDAPPPQRKKGKRKKKSK